jgi:NAD(P)-dependent dehydrogenase (short-subunit alcohol dehydrogenase family)
LNRQRVKVKSEMHLDLTDKIAFVSAGASGIGSVIAQTLMAQGANVFVSDIDADTLSRFLTDHATAKGTVADAGSWTDTQNVFAEIQSIFGRLDILVNGEDREFGKPLLETSLDEWQRVFDVNVTSVFLCSKAVAPIMMEQGQGKIINISSVLAERVVAGGTAYCASKGAISQLTQALALEWGPNQISINAVAVGWFADGQVDLMEDLKQPVVRMIPQRRRGQPEDIAGIVVYLASDAGSYTTGQTILMDGGAHTHA